MCFNLCDFDLVSVPKLDQLEFFKFSDTANKPGKEKQIRILISFVFSKCEPRSAFRLEVPTPFPLKNSTP